MKILYGIQGTGNGHVSRAREVIPHLMEHGEVDILLSGTQAEVQLPWPIKYRLHGWSFIFGKKGGVDFWASWKRMNTIRLLRDIWNLPVQKYDIIISDFEPISAWAAKLRGRKCIAMSHQAAFLSPKTPRPTKRKWFIEMVFKWYAPCTKAVGFHFERYDDFIYTPVIRSEIRNLSPRDEGHITVYLPAHHDRLLVKYFNQIGHVKFEVFSKHTTERYVAENVYVAPINNEEYNKSLEGCHGLITAGGFEGPTEAIYLGKKVMVIPMMGQYEQHCNAIGAKKAGCTVLAEINGGFINQLKSWIEFGKPIKINYPDETAEIVSRMLAPYKKAQPQHV